MIPREAAEAASRAKSKGLELLCEVATEVPEISRGDITRLRQVLLNLVGNAIKFTNEGEVAVKVQQEAKDEHGVILHFTVSDTGIGIPENKREMIFAPFAQADTVETPWLLWKKPHWKKRPSTFSSWTCRCRKWMVLKRRQPFEGKKKAAGCIK